MRLKKLELYGFKSFAQRTEIVFNEGITGIVGPNGSGKSNIADAVRWVLGEQSAKTLRGASMQDVIFGGTQSRKPLSYCEVSLIFENEDHFLPVDYSEVMVTRRVYRSGDSEYYLNRTACRLKDIVDLFRDTGVGKEGYSIIGQGRIDEILSRKGEDRRLVFEEAAGIVKYRARKEEADRKLAKTRENMTRIDDILEELNRQLVPLEEQAKNARIYLEKAAQLKELDLNLFLVRSDRMEARLREADRDLQNLRTVLEQTENTLQEKTAARDACQEEINALEEKLRVTREGLLAGMEQVHAAQDALRAVEERRKNRQENRQRLQSEQQAGKQRLEELETLFTESREGGESRSETLRNREEALEQARQAETEARENEEQKEQALESHKSAMMDVMNRRAAVLSDQTRLNTMLSAMETRLQEITVSCGEMKQAEITLEEVLAEARRRLQQETALQKERNTALESTRAALETADRNVIHARQEYDGKLAEMRDMESRRKMLAEMAREMDGYSNAVKSVMKAAREQGLTGVHGAVSQLLEVPRQYETAMEMALGASQQHVVTENEETARDLIEYLRRKNLGRATFLPMTTVKSRLLTEREREALRLPGCLGVASELVRFDEAYRGIVENLLGRTVVADNLNHGIAIMRRGNHAFRLVTLAGDVMHSGGSMTGGSVSSRTVNLFSRERELRELTEGMEGQQLELERLLREMQNGQAEKDRLKESAAGALEELHQQEIAVARETERTRNAEDELQTHTVRLREMEAAREQLMESMMQIREQLSMADQNSEKSDETREEMEKKAGELQQALTDARRKTEERADAALKLTLEVNDLRHELEEMKRDQARFLQEKERMEREGERRERLLADMEHEDAGDAADAAKRSAELEMKQLEQAQRERITASLEEDRSRKQAVLREILSDMEALHESHTRDSDRAHRLELGRTRTEGELKALRDRIWDTYEMTYAGAEEYRRKESFNLTEADRQAAQLSTEIRALGPVNVRAVEEYADTRARAEEMNSQRRDLEKAEADLRELIEQLLEQMTATFVEGFTQLQGHFSECFRRLFGGGHAELILTDPGDPLNCGIEINAQPPGKKLQLLSLLSGGERALTAIAILFATLKLKPTPFCVLDEIEAALDDANIGYFADYLAEFSASTQFVVITHRKGTMERADSLYGVAMEEKGISKMVSVSLKDYEE